jgi:hypothetical protein
MLKFLVQTFYQLLFSHTFPFSNFPLAILFPSVILSPSKSPNQESRQSPSQTPKPKKPKAKIKKPQALLQWVFYKWQTGWNRGSLGEV